MGTHRGAAAYARAVMQRQHWRAALNALRVPTRPDLFLPRYLTGKGRYPWSPRLRTPIGVVSPTCWSFHDVMTVNEVFCRLDYATGRTPAVVVDVGSNIGVSALWFLTRAESVSCYLFEPAPDNIHRLKANLHALEARWSLAEVAIDVQAGVRSFGIEGTGRYGGLGRRLDDEIEVQCLGINDALRDVLAREDRVSLLKVDIEGLEVAVIRAIDHKLLDRIDAIYFEDGDREFDGRFAEGFNVSRTGELVRLVNERSSTR